MVSSYNIVVLGPEKVGKSALVHQFLKKDFVSTYEPTVEESYKYVAKMSDGVFKSVDILDTAGCDDFPVMRKLRIKRGDAFVIVYSVDDMNSFINIKSYYEQISQEKGTTVVPIILVGNKMDTTSRQVSTEMATRLAKEDLKCFHLETSAKCNLNVENMFSILFLKTIAASVEMSQTKQFGKRQRKRSINFFIRRNSKKVQLRKNEDISKSTLSKDKVQTRRHSIHTFVDIADAKTIDTIPRRVSFNV
ncbi:hypothetical protein SNE40_011516 [Patella caerulea]|uniref:Uncharacterized protein n=1 Tax=Patella caerulea TaxID=87958 RepID=A0AAN8JMV2_PATCE